MPGIFVKNLSKELVEYIRGLRGNRTWANWFRELQSDFRKKQERIDELEKKLEDVTKENTELRVRVTRLQLKPDIRLGLKLSEMKEL